MVKFLEEQFLTSVLVRVTFGKPTFSKEFLLLSNWFCLSFFGGWWGRVGWGRGTVVFGNE